MFCQKSVLRNFANFIGKHLCQSLFFNKVVGLKSATLQREETLAQVFSGEFCEISKNTFFLQSTPRWLLLKVATGGWRPEGFIKKGLQHMCFTVNILKFLRTPILKNCERRLLPFSLVISYY